jgi:hypothetical protein
MDPIAKRRSGRLVLLLAAVATGWLTTGPMATVQAEMFVLGTTFTAPDGASHPALNTEFYQWDSSWTTNAPTPWTFDNSGYSRGIAVSPTREYAFALHGDATGMYLYRFGADESKTRWQLGAGDLPLPAGGVGKLSFAPNGDLLLPSISSSGGGGIVQITQSGSYVRTISTGGHGLWDAACMPGTRYIYGLEGSEGGAARDDLYRIDTVSGAVTAVQLKNKTYPYTTRPNNSDLAILPNGNLAVTRFYVNSSYPAVDVFNTSGQLQTSSYANDGGWSSGMAYDPTLNHLVTSKYDEYHGVLHFDLSNNLDRVNMLDFRLASPVRTEKGTGNSWDIAIAGEQSFITTPPRHSQAQGGWGSDAVLGNTSLQLSNAGCFVSSTAMLLSALGHNVTPRQLNDWIVDNTSHRDGYLRFGALPQSLEYGQTDGVQGPPVRFRMGSFASDATRDDVMDRLGEIIGDYGPVILRVPQIGRGTNGYYDQLPTNHAVVAWKVENGEIYIRDPGWLADNLATQYPGLTMDNLTLDHYIQAMNNSLDAGEAAFAVTGQTVEGQPDLAFLQSQRYTFAQRVTPMTDDALTGVANSPIDFIITDAQGRRMGYDPTFDNGDGTFGKYYDEIPEGSYYHLDTNVGAFDDTTVPTETPIVFFLPDPDAGKYGITVFPTGPGDYSIEFGLGVGSDYDPLQYRLTGDNNDGNPDQFFFNIVPEPATGVMLLLLALPLRRRRTRRL